MKKKYIIPIFVPHLGCPNDCTFCNQKKISGKQNEITEEDVRGTIEFYLKNIKSKDAKKEIAFYGGSFTGIEPQLQEKLLKIAYEYIKSKDVSSIRVSTRPDYINKEILKRLKKYKVKTIELGVQSTNDYVLKQCRRGHTYEDVVKASKLIKRYRFTLGHQMMVGLPESSEKDDIQTAKDLIKLKPKIVRIYPVLVIKDTELEKQYLSNDYDALSIEQAVERSREIYDLFRKKHITVIRIGLQNTDEISSPENDSSQVVAGPYHESFRQLVEAAFYYDIILEKLKKISSKVKEIEIQTNSKDLNNVVGYKRENLEKLKEFYGLDVKVKQNDKIKSGKIIVKPLKIHKDFLDDKEEI